MAAIWANHTPEEFLEADVEYQAMVLQAYRTDKKIEAILAYEASKK